MSDDDGFHRGLYCDRSHRDEKGLILRLTLDHLDGTETGLCSFRLTDVLCVRRTLRDDLMTE